MSVRRPVFLIGQGLRSTEALSINHAARRSTTFGAGSAATAASTARPGRLHRGPAGASTVQSMNLTEEPYLPGDEALLDY